MATPDALADRHQCRSPRTRHRAAPRADKTLACALTQANCSSRRYACSLEEFNAPAFASGQAAAFTSIFFSAFCTSGLFGRVTVSTPFLNAASILLLSTP